MNYKAGQYAIVDLGVKEDSERSDRAFTIASSPTEEGFILFSTRIRNTPFKKKLAIIDVDDISMDDLSYLIITNYPEITLNTYTCTYYIDVHKIACLR